MQAALITSNKLLTDNHFLSLGRVINITFYPSSFITIRQVRQGFEPLGYVKANMKKKNQRDSGSNLIRYNAVTKYLTIMKRYLLSY